MEIGDSYRINMITKVVDFYFPNIDWGSHGIKSINGWNMSSFQESFFRKYIEGLLGRGKI